MPSLRKTRRKLQKQVIRWTVWGTIFLIFVIGTFTSFGIYRQMRTTSLLPTTIAKVNGVKLYRQDFNKKLILYFRQNMPVADYSYTKKSVLDQMIRDELINQEAKRRGVYVTRIDINKYLNEKVQIELSAARHMFETNKSYRDFIRERYGSLDNYAEVLRKETFQQANFSQQDLLEEKLRDAVRKEVKVTEKDLRESYTKLQIRDIFISFDRFLPKDKPAQDKDREEAKKKAKETAERLMQRLLKGEDFIVLAKNESDDPITAKNGGDFGEVSFDNLKWRLGEKAPEILSEMNIKDISKPIEGFNGYHIVKLEGKKVKFPEDYEDIRYLCKVKKCGNNWLGKKGEKTCPRCKNDKIKVISTRKKELMEELKVRRTSEMWSQMEQDLLKNAVIEVYDPELKAIQLAGQGDFKQARKFYREALNITEQIPDARQNFLLPEVLHYELSRTYLNEGKFKEAEREVRLGLKYSDDNDLHLHLGSLLMLQAKKEPALKEFLYVAKSSPKPYQRFRLADYFDQLGRKDLALQQRKIAQKEMEGSKQSLPFKIN